MKRVLIIVGGLLILFACVCHAEELPAPLTKEGATPAKVLDKETDYIVKKGDTLWDISKRFYDDAFLWPRLWQQNQYITNPHEIAPGDRIRLYPYRVLIEEEAKPPTVKETLPPPHVAETLPPLPPPPQIIRLTVYPEVNSAGFIADKMEGIGRIVAAKLPKVQFVDEDEIYVSFQKGISVKKGDQFTIFRVGEPLIHPITQKVLGRKVRILGKAVITKAAEGVAQTALITRSYEAMLVGDQLTPYFAPREALEVQKVEQPMYGWIVGEQRTGKLEFAEGDVVFIDVGEEDHVQPGNIFNVLRRGAVVDYPVAETEKKIKKKDIVKVKLPDELIARLVVIKAQQRTSTALIVQARDSVSIGDEVTTVGE